MARGARDPTRAPFAAEWHARGAAALAGAPREGGECAQAPPPPFRTGWTLHELVASKLVDGTCDDGLRSMTLRA